MGERGQLRTADNELGSCHFILGDQSFVDLHCLGKDQDLGLARISLSLKSHSHLLSGLSRSTYDPSAIYQRLRSFVQAKSPLTVAIGYSANAFEYDPCGKFSANVDGMMSGFKPYEA